LYENLCCRKDDKAILLDADLFPDFRGQKHSCNSFTEESEDADVQPYLASINIIRLYREKTMEVIELFQNEVIAKAHDVTEEKADIILSTAHSAKGLESDNVEILDDFIELCKITRIQMPADRKRKADEVNWGFDYAKYSDDVNLLYVACTRARKRLGVGSNFRNLICDMDVLHRWMLDREMKASASIFAAEGTRNESKKGKQNEWRLFSIFKLKEPSNDDLEKIYVDIVAPLRNQLDLTSDKSLEQHLLGSTSKNNTGVKT